MMDPDDIVAEFLEPEEVDWLEHEDWEGLPKFKEVPIKVRLAAKLLVWGVETSRVEKILSLPEGELTRWIADDEAQFMSVGRLTYAGWQQSPDRVMNLEAVLTPRQINGAEAYFVEGLNQKQAAEAAGVTDRTLRTWLQDAAFVLYGERRLREEIRLRGRERERRRARIAERSLVQLEKSQEVLEAAMDNGDVRAAIAVARLHARLGE